MGTILQVRYNDIVTDVENGSLNLWQLQELIQRLSMYLEVQTQEDMNNQK